MITHTDCRSCLVYDPSLADYDFGQTHPMDPIRVSLTVSLARQLGALPSLVPAPSATEEQLLTVPPCTMRKAMQLKSLMQRSLQEDAKKQQNS